jgi:hypothetical protein
MRNWFQVLVSISTCAAIARGGHLEMLKWAREQGCPWHTNSTYAAAIEAGAYIHTFVYFPAQFEPCLTYKNALHTLNTKHP